MKVKIIDFGYEQMPVRKHYNDTGLDIYLLNDISIKPFEIVQIPIGFGIELPDGYNAQFQVRTSVAQKGVFIHQCAIDAGYRGELRMLVQNTTERVVDFKKGDRIGYLVVYPVQYIELVKDLGEERGENWAGSTGR